MPPVYRSPPPSPHVPLTHYILFFLSFFSSYISFFLSSRLGSSTSQFLSSAASNRSRATTRWAPIRSEPARTLSHIGQHGIQIPTYDVRVPCSARATSAHMPAHRPAPPPPPPPPPPRIPIPITHRHWPTSLCMRCFTRPTAHLLERMCPSACDSIWMTYYLCRMAFLFLSRLPSRRHLSLTHTHARTHARTHAPLPTMLPRRRLSGRRYDREHEGARGHAV